MTTPLVLTSLAELRDFLANPHAHEDLEEPILVAKLPEAIAPQDRKADSGQDLADSLRALPAVAVLLTEDAENTASQLSPAGKTADEPDSLARHFDIITDNAAGDLEDIAETVIASPQASVSLVQLLRAGETMSVRDALMAESWVYSTLQGGHVFQNWLQTQKPNAESTSSEQAMQADRETTSQPVVLADETSTSLCLTLNRPERRNAFSAEMRDCLVEALRAARASPPPGGIVLKGAGEAFCSGGDLNEFGTTPDSATAHIVRSLRNAAWEMHLLRDRIRVEMHGACVGAGIELPAFTSNITSTPDTFFWLPEVRLGLVPGAGGTVSLPRRIGRHRTAWLALTDRRLLPAQALEWGLIDLIV